MISFETPTIERIRAACAALPEADPDPIVLVIMGDAEFDWLKRMTRPFSDASPSPVDSCTGLPIHVIAGFNGAKQVRRSQLRGLMPGEYVDVVTRALAGVSKGLCR